MLARRLIWLIPLVLVAAAGYSAFLAWQVKGDLEDAETAAQDFQGALDARERSQRDEAIADLQRAAEAAKSRTDGGWWSAMTYLPLVGDDAEGVRALSSSLDIVATDGVDGLASTVGSLSGLIVDGRIDLAKVEDLRPEVAEARAAFRDAAREVEGVDSSGYAGSVRTRFDDYVELVSEAEHMLGSAETAAEVLPGMAGGEGPRNYLLIFQNNAEIRATGGMPGSWALIHTDQGKLSMRAQGTAGDFPMRKSPVLPMSRAELDVYDNVMGIYFQSSNFTPDFPRAADLWAARWAEVMDGPPLDGVLSLDPVAMSYLLNGTGPVEVADRTLTSENAVDELLSRPYLELDVQAQDALFAAAARAIFDAMTGDLDDPLEFIKGIARAADEGRFLVAPFAEDERSALDDTRVQGSLPSDDGTTPYVNIGLNDATASKLSYYLRYNADLRAAGCTEGVQMVRGSMSLSQSIAPSEAAELPDSVTGGGIYGNDVGDQLVFVRIYGPHGGTIDGIRMDGRRLDPEVVQLDGRPVVTLIVELSTTDDVVINWAMESGQGQTGDIRLGMTPSVVPGNNDETIPTAC